MNVRFFLGLGVMLIATPFILNVVSDVSDCSVDNYYLICTEGFTGRVFNILIGLVFIVIGYKVMVSGRSQPQ